MRLLVLTYTKRVIGKKCPGCLFTPMASQLHELAISFQENIALICLIGYLVFLVLLDNLNHQKKTLNE